ncbi:hypothetical protein M404DRAFT_712695 [Pisolithus tinctorius Marx 270]|uniref:Uncharacterized protein n=1 Tax=Pisolithus tinctorius Marx 270 TaxID=870435 RepID=A0A0C3JXG3_PISTI|nr:hypothetical protein M404DRAFT_712695 [Pisolithus tinctorius Marx 270]
MIEVPSRSRTSHAPGRNIQSSSSSMSAEMTGLSSTRRSSDICRCQSTVFVHGLGFSSKAVPRLYRISSHPVEHGDEYSGVRIKNNIDVNRSITHSSPPTPLPFLIGAKSLHPGSRFTHDTSSIEILPKLSPMHRNWCCAAHEYFSRNLILLSKCVSSCSGLWRCCASNWKSCFSHISE